MADEKLDWELKLADLMSGPLAKIEERFAAVEKAMGALAGSDVDKALGRKAKAAEDKVSQALSGAKAKLVGARADFAQAWSALLTATAPVGDRAAKALEPMFASLKNASGRVGGFFSSAFSSVMSTHLGPAAQRMGETWRKVMTPIGGALSSVMGTHLRPVMQRLTETFAPLGGKVSAVFGAIGGKLAGFGRSAATVLGPLGSGLGKVFGAAGQVAGALGQKLGPALAGLGKYAGAGLGALVGIAGALTAAAGAIAIAAGRWALSGLQFKEDTLVSFKTMLGTEDAAQRVFRQATKFAATTPFSSEEVVGGFQKFLIAGFKEDQLDQLMRAVGDVGANMGTQKMDQVITGLSQIKAKGKLQGEEMMQLAEAGVGQAAVFEALAKTLGISKAQAQARVTGGQVTGEQGIAAILEAIKTTQSGGELGSAMEGKSKTLTGLWSSLLDIPSTLLFASDMDGVTEPIKRAIKGVIDAFDEGAPLFTRAQKAFERIGRAWGKAFGTMADTDTEGLLAKIIDGTEMFFTSLAPFAEGFFPQMMTELTKIFALLGGSGSPEEIRANGESVAKALGLTASALITLGGAVGWFIDKIVWFFEKLGSAAAWVFGGTGGGISDDDENIRRAEEARRQLQLIRQGQGGGAIAANGQPVPPNITTSVGQVIVQVGPGEQQAGIAVANQIQAQTPQQLTNYATEMGG